MKNLMRPATGPLLAALLALGGCGDWAGTDQFQDRLEAIDAVYKQGQDARKLFTDRGIEISEKHCADAFVSTGASEENPRTGRKDDKAFQALRAQAFTNGCMDRPNDVTGVISGTPLPSSSAAPSAAAS
jgi:hypothetical protein